MSDVLLSVIIPAYNCEKYIESTIRSVIEQPGDGIECIVVDDGSTDRTAQIIDRFSEIENVHVYHKKNEGLCLTKNYGLDKANGQYITFLDSDDMICKDAYTDELVNILKTFKYDVISPSYIVADQDLKYGKIYWRNDCEYRTDEDKDIPRPIYHDAFSIVKREMIGLTRFNPYSVYYEDWAFSAMVGYRVKTVLMIKYPWYVWRMNNQSMTHSYSDEKKTNLLHWTGAFVHMLENATSDKEREDAAAGILKHSYNVIYYRTAYGYPLKQTLEQYERDEVIKRAREIYKGDAMTGLPRYNLLKSHPLVYTISVRIDMFMHFWGRRALSIAFIRKIHQKYKLGFTQKLKPTYLNGQNT